ncbi:M20 family metallopeptidase [Nocardioides albidus]|uniref:Peptidase M20 domain-containing protein 2 n=1 Tax=Nocardioides albidus TaxID=1517589 RepID=A0A5C4VQ15_9ACTN|nr:M20 family metallopeptidase [Nocardioides albidus]TNM37399.1 M20 family metallopeptidase [Nocardioides albidus]
MTSLTTDVTAGHRAEQAVRAAQDQLVALSHEVHGYAELAFEEHQTAAAVSDALSAAGFSVEAGVAGLPTAFIATYGTGDLVVGICAEYDALPEIGHACGHNIIASSAVGAALGLAEVADELGLTVKVLGTPAEEHGGGKVLMLEAGCFDDLTVSLMIHPGPTDVAAGSATSQGVARFAATFTGIPSHAAAAPHLGVNAADAAVVSQVAIGLLRQQLPATARIAAFVSEGGKVTNIIPERVVVDFEVREFDMTAQERLIERVHACFEAGALATGCSLTIEPTEPAYAPLLQDVRLGEPFTAALTALGREVHAEGKTAGGSTDMGNVSQYLPAIHPMVAVGGSENSPHTHAFAADAVSPAGDVAVVDSAIAMARTIVAVAQDPTVRAELLAEQAARAPYAAPSASQSASPSAPSALPSVEETHA